MLGVQKQNLKRVVLASVLHPLKEQTELRSAAAVERLLQKEVRMATGRLASLFTRVLPPSYLPQRYDVSSAVMWGSTGVTGALWMIQVRIDQQSGVVVRIEQAYRPAASLLLKPPVSMCREACRIFLRSSGVSTIGRVLC